MEVIFINQKDVRRKQLSVYFTEDEKAALTKLAKRVGGTPSQIIREAVMTFAFHPELDYLIDQRVLFKTDPKEISLVQKLLPEITRLAKIINELANNETIE